MPRVVLALFATLLVSLAAPVAPVRAGTEAKVVVVVGPVGGSTAHYKDDARQVVAEARRHTSNVVKVFTPNATWSRVKEAAQGANVLVYLGHGNGWPSRYGPFQTQTKNGLGLDPAVGADSTRTVYYGEEYLRRDIRLAPNAVVLLYHLCYASGNTEPGLRVGSFADSRARVDNYGAGFIGAGARAVIAEGHPAHPVVSEIRQLFTTNRTMDELFRSAATYHGNVLGPYPAQRTPGLAYLMDPDRATPSGFYRSIVGDLSLRASQVVAPALRPTDTAPEDFLVPGAAEVVAPDGAGIWGRADNAADPASSPPDVLQPGTRLRLTSGEASTPDGNRVFGIRVLGSSRTGFVRASSLAPRDSAGVDAWTLDRSAAWLSPNGDGANDALVVTARFSEPATGVLKVRDAAGGLVRTIVVEGDIARFEWDLGAAAGSLAPDGDYTWTLRAADAWGNPAYAADGSFTVDGTPPVTVATVEAAEGNGGWLVSPPMLTLTASDAMSGVGSVRWRLEDAGASAYQGPVTLTAQGAVSLRYRAIDRSGIREPWNTLELRIDTLGPEITLPMTGRSSDVPGTWRGKVTVTPGVRDVVSGLAKVRYSVDGEASEPLGTDPIVVRGDGGHTVTVIATDLAGNRTRATQDFLIDATPPVLELATPGSPIPTVAPNDDGTAETVELGVSASEPGTLVATIEDIDGTPVRALSLPISAGPNVVTWDGRDEQGAPVPDGRYTVSMVGRDLPGNTSAPITAEVDVYAALARLTLDPVLFYPQDDDALASRTRASWSLLAPARVSIEVVDGAGNVVRHGPTDRAYQAGDAGWRWNGRDDAGAFVPVGKYRVVVSATNGVQSAVQQVPVRADAFRLATSVAAALRGQSLVLRAVSSEPLATAPTVVVRQPGLDPWTAVMTARGNAWTAEITLRKQGADGTLTLVVKARDTAGGRNVSRLQLPLD